MDGNYICDEDHRKLMEYKATVLIQSCMFYIENPVTGEKLYPTEADNVQEGSTESTISNEEPLRLFYEDIDFYKYVFNDTVTIKVEGDLFFVDDASSNDTALPPANLHEDMNNLYKNEVLTDTLIKCGDKEFKVHRVILAMQSPVFRAMFEADMKEKQSGVIEISDSTPEAMSDLVAYLYAGTAPNLKTLASELLDMAEKYQIPRLLTMCRIELARKIKNTNVVETLILADLHGKSALKKACFKFIRLNSAEVFQTSEWADFKAHKDQYASLFVEVLENVLTIM